MYNSAHIVFTGSHHNLCAYFSKGGKCIIRSRSSLTSDRVARDPAFAGFRQSGNRMKEASPIAAALYRLIPKEQRQYALYRILTGETLKMIKLGMDKETIIKELSGLYLRPVLQERKKRKQPAQVMEQAPPKQECISFRDRPSNRSGTHANISNMRSFIRHPQYSMVRKRLSVKRYADTYSGEMVQIKEVVTKKQTCSSSEFPKPPTPPGPIYLGREKKFNKFTMWLMPESVFTINDMRKITELLIRRSDLKY